MLVLAGLAFVIALGLLVFRLMGSPSEIVRITSIRNGETVTPPTTLAGTASQLKRGHHLGLAACFPDLRCFIYFDQDIAVRSGVWSAPHVMFGEQGDAGKGVTLLAIVTTDGERQLLDDYLRNPPRRPVCKIPDEIPGVIRVRDKLAATVAQQQQFPSPETIAGLPLCVPVPLAEPPSPLPYICMLLAATAAVVALGHEIHRLINKLSRAVAPKKV